MHICTHISFDTVHEYESASGEKLSSGCNNIEDSTDFYYGRKKK